MVCCLLCFEGTPADDDPKHQRPNTFNISMMDGLTKNQPWCCVTYFCAPCSAYYTRYRALDENLANYTCCQGYLDGPCFKAGSCGEQSCPEVCLCVESFCCLGPSMSSSRMYIMDKYDLRPDPCDNKIIRLSNCLQVLSCFCTIASIFVPELRDGARIIRNIADMVFYCTMGCMAAQVNNEITIRKSQGDQGKNMHGGILGQDIYGGGGQPGYVQQQPGVVYAQGQPAYGQPQQQVVYVQQPVYAQQPIYGQQQPVYVVQQSNMQTPQRM